MQTTLSAEMEASVLNKFVEFPSVDMTKARLVTELVQGSPWGATQLTVYGSTSDKGSKFFVVTGAPTPSTEGITAEFDIGSIRRLRVVVSIAGAAGVIIRVYACLSNPSITGSPTPPTNFATRS